MCPENEDRAESFNGDQVIFVNTELIQRAVAGLQRSREEFQALLDQAELGDLSAQYDLAMKYADGDGVDRDMAQAAHWFAQAAEQDDMRAVEALGRCYQLGEGVEKDEKREVELFQRCVD